MIGLKDTPLFTSIFLNSKSNFTTSTSLKEHAINSGDYRSLTQLVTKLLHTNYNVFYT